MVDRKAMSTTTSLFQLIADGDHYHHHHQQQQQQQQQNNDDYGDNTTSFLLAAGAATTAAGNQSFDYGLSSDAEFEIVTCYECIIVPVIFCIVIVLGCIGNLLVLVVVVRNREQFTSTTNLFIVNLAVADLFFLIFCVPFHAIIYTTENWPFGDALCKLVHFVQFASMTASVYTLVAMSLDRFLAVGYPLRTKHLRTPPYALAVAVAIWTASAVLASPWSVFFKVVEYQTVPYCADDWRSVGKKHRPTGYLILFIVGYAIPLSSIGILSALTVRQLWATETTNDEPSRRRSMVAKRRVTRLIAVVVGVFAFCWLPSHVIWLWTNYSPLTWHNTYPFYYGRIAAHVLSYANSSMNPIIYAFLSSRFRREFQRAVRCRRQIRAGAGAGVLVAGSRVGGSPSATGSISVNGGGVRRSARVATRRDRALGGTIALVDGVCGSNSSIGSGVQRPAAATSMARCYHFQRGDHSRMTTTSNTSEMTTVMMPMTRRLAPVTSQRKNHTRGIDDEDDDVIVF